jgi:hypothetical protein
LRSKPRSAIVPLVAAVTACLVSCPALAEDWFDVVEIESRGRTLSADIGDLNGDGLDDLMQFISTGLPPDESRSIRVYLQTDAGIPTVPSFETPIPSGVAAYDLGDVLDRPGIEILLLRPTGLTVLSLAEAAGGAPVTLDLPLPGAMSVGAGEDERGLDRIEIVTDALGPTPWLQVPGFGEVFYLAADGSLLARIDVGGRANYFIQPPGPVFAESDIQLYFDAPRMAMGDVDGDGRVDILSASRHELRVFLRREDGGFQQAPDRIVALRRVSESDHIRGSGSVRTIARDIDGDGLLDLLVSETRGGITDASAVTSVYLNTGGDWNLDESDAAYPSKDAVSTDLLIDLDGDSKFELVRFVVPINVLELVEVFVTRAIDANLSIYAASGAGAYPDAPVYKRKLDIPLDFETSRPKGFIPSFGFDLNGDGVRDYLASSDGTEIEVLLATPKLEYRKRGHKQEIPSEGAVRGGDLNHDGLTDLVVFNARRYHQSMYLAINRGALPGTRRGGFFRSRD